MRRLLLLLGLWMVGWLGLRAQYVDLYEGNLVPNSGFEQTRACPKDCDYIGGVMGWNRFPNYSSDYFHRCANVYQTEEYRQYNPFEEVLPFGVPSNLFGYQEAHGGDAYAGISFCMEALAVKLEEALVKDSTYRLEMYVSLSDSSNVATRYLGMYLSEYPMRSTADSWMQITGFVLEGQPQLASSKYLTDTAQWTCISGDYKAKGGEQYLAISGFLPYADSLVCWLGDNRALKSVYRSQEPYLGYYYVDDVSVRMHYPKWEPEVDSVYILKHVYFAFDKSELLPASGNELDLLVEYMLEHEGVGVSIVGHCDNFGEEGYNAELSASRARAVADYLVSRGVVEERIKHEGMGSRYPIADNETEEGRQLNRRVEFKIYRR